MLVPLIVLYSSLFITGNPVDDLEIVGSDSHFAFEPRTKDGAGESAGYYHTHDSPGRFDAIQQEDPPIINFPVKTVQRFKDADGNIKIVTSYSNRDDNPLPIYKDMALRQKALEQVRSLKPAGEEIQNTPSANFPTPLGSTVAPRVDRYEYVTQAVPRSRPTKQEYSASKTIKFPNQDGQLVANEHQTSSTDGTSSSYNQNSSYKTKYKKPPLKVVQKSAASSTSDSVKGDTKELSNTPLEEAGSNYVSDIEDGFEGGEGYSEGSSSFSNHGGGELSDYRGGSGPAVFESVGDDDDDGIQEHGGGYGGYGGGDGISHHGHHSHGSAFKKGHGSSYHHGNNAAKGDHGDKGFAKKEKYEKGHSESHGHEEQKGGQKEESGGKVGHLDEGSQYAKGHAESHGSEGKEQGHSKGHKKGHKTKGFRTVHHKDEYKKDEVFYDEEHDAGHQKGHGHHHESQKKVKGGNHKKGHLDSGYKNAQKGFQGDKEKGHSYKNSKGHAGNSGNSHYKGHQAHFDKAAGHKGAEAHGHEHYEKGH